MEARTLVEKIESCRICGNKTLLPIFDLGNQALGSRFPSKDESEPIDAPLILVKCEGECGLLQLLHNVSSEELYCHNYGYRSGLNNTMIGHLGSLVNQIEKRVILSPDDIVVDIGSNDCTLLKSYTKDVVKVGIDPTGTQFKEYYPNTVTLIPDFFSDNAYKNTFGEKKAKVVTSISMFYDLPSPVTFAKHIANILDDNGIWVTEQSYAITMMEKNSFDTVCHEHLEYYCMKQMKYIADQAGLCIVDVSLNECNGGSFRVTMEKKKSDNSVSENVGALLAQEGSINLDTFIGDFVGRCETLKQDLNELVQRIVKENKTIYLYGASTKGNTLLQYYGLDNTIILGAAERNPEKYGCRTPKTNIIIMSEEEVRSKDPDYMLVLPWHFRDEFVVREKEYLEGGGNLIFPLPKIEVVSIESLKKLKQ